MKGLSMAWSAIPTWVKLATLLAAAVAGAAVGLWKTGHWLQWVGLGVMCVGAAGAVWVFAGTLLAPKDDAIFERILKDMGHLNEEDRERLESLREKLVQGLTYYRDRLRRESKEGGKGSLYTQPWFLLVGPTGSGKTTLLEKSELEFFDTEERDWISGKRLNVSGTGGTFMMDWWFGRDSVMIDTAGGLLTEDPAAWEAFLSMLKEVRPTYPINGMMLCVDGEQLRTQSNKEFEDMLALVRKGVDKVRQSLGVRFPVYVILTKCDRIPGFDAVFSPQEETDGWSHQIVGWSDGTKVAKADGARAGRAAPVRLVENLQSLRRSIARRRDAFLATQTRKDGLKRADAVHDAVLLPDAFDQKVIPRLQKFVEKVVPAEVGDKTMPVFFRGVYFTSSLSEGIAIDDDLLRAFGNDREALMRKLEAIGAMSMKRERGLFIHNLLGRKVTREAGLVAASGNIGREQFRRRMFTVVVSGVAASLALGAILLGYRSLDSQIGGPLAAFKTVADKGEGIVAPAITNGTIDGKQLDMLLALADAGSRDISTFFFPKNLEKDRRRAIAVDAIQRGVLDPLAQSVKTRLVERLDPEKQSGRFPWWDESAVAAAMGLDPARTSEDLADRLGRLLTFLDRERAPSAHPALDSLAKGDSGLRLALTTEDFRSLKDSHSKWVPGGEAVDRPLHAAELLARISAKLGEAEQAAAKIKPEGNDFSSLLDSFAKEESKQFLRSWEELTRLTRRGALLTEASKSGMTPGQLADSAAKDLERIVNAAKPLGDFRASSVKPGPDVLERLSVDESSLSLKPEDHLAALAQFMGDPKDENKANAFVKARNLPELKTLQESIGDHLKFVKAVVDLETRTNALQDQSFANDFIDLSQGVKFVPAASLEQLLSQTRGMKPQWEADSLNGRKDRVVASLTEKAKQSHETLRNKLGIRIAAIGQYDWAQLRKDAASADRADGHGRVVGELAELGKLSGRDSVASAVPASSLSQIANIEDQMRAASKFRDTILDGTLKKGDEAESGTWGRAVFDRMAALLSEEAKRIGKTKHNELVAVLDRKPIVANRRDDVTLEGAERALAELKRAGNPAHFAKYVDSGWNPQSPDVKTVLDGIERWLDAVKRASFEVVSLTAERKANRTLRSVGVAGTSFYDPNPDLLSAVKAHLKLKGDDQLRLTQLGTIELRPDPTSPPKVAADAATIVQKCLESGGMEYTLKPDNPEEGYWVTIGLRATNGSSPLQSIDALKLN